VAIRASAKRRRAGTAHCSPSQAVSTFRPTLRRSPGGCEGSITALAASVAPEPVGQFTPQSIIRLPFLCFWWWIFYALMMSEMAASLITGRWRPYG